MPTIQRRSGGGHQLKVAVRFTHFSRSSSFGSSGVPGHPQSAAVLQPVHGQEPAGTAGGSSSKRELYVAARSKTSPSAAFELALSGGLRYERDGGIVRRSLTYV